MDPLDFLSVERSKFIWQIFFMDKMGGSDRTENLVGILVESRASKNAVYAKVYMICCLVTK